MTRITDEIKIPLAATGDAAMKAGKEFESATIRNPLTIAKTVEANGDDPLSEQVDSLVGGLLLALEGISQNQRAVVFQILTDFYCPRCGIEQPEGDCQCRNT